MPIVLSFRLVLQAVCVAAVLVAFLPADGARAQTASWRQGDTGGNWSLTTNWDPIGNPTTGQTATLGNVTSGARSPLRLEVSGPTTTAVITIETGGEPPEIESLDGGIVNEGLYPAGQ
jgi:hypothetical protein